MKIIVMIFVVLLISTNQNQAQVLKCNLQFKFEGIDPNKIQVFIDNGQSINKIHFKSNIKKQNYIISTNMHYLKVIFLNKYIKDSFENNENYYIKNSEVVFEINNKKAENENYNIMPYNIENIDNYKEYKNKLKNDIIILDSLKKNNLNNDKKIEALVLSIYKKELDFIKINNQTIIAQDMYLKKIKIYHYLKSKSELMNYYNETFKKNVKNTLYKSLVTSAIANLELDINSIVPSFKARDIKNSIINLNTIRNKYIIINYWATWCKPCIEEIPYLYKLLEKCKEKDIVFLFISEDKNEDILTKYINKYQLKGIHILDVKQKISDEWNINSIPKTYLINNKRKLIYSSEQSKDLKFNELEKLINTL